MQEYLCGAEGVHVSVDEDEGAAEATDNVEEARAEVGHEHLEGVIEASEVH